MIVLFWLKLLDSSRNYEIPGGINSLFPLPVLPFVHTDLLFLIVVTLEHVVPIVVTLEHVVLMHILAREISQAQLERRLPARGQECMWKFDE